MKNDNIIQIETYNFALKIIRLYQFLIKEHKEFVISKQVLRCGTSIGANIEEAIGGQSGKDFLAKISISYKEARETHFWIRLLHDTDYITIEKKDELLKDVDTILRIIGSIQITMKEKLSIK